MLEFHNVHGEQMLTCLWLRVVLVTSHKEQGGVHDSSSCEHGSHEGVVTWAIDEGNVTQEDEGSLLLTERAQGIVRMETAVGHKALRRWALGALV